MITLKIAVRNIFRHRTRSTITLSAIAFGCIALIFAGGYFEDVFYKMRESYIHGHTGHIQIYKSGFLEKGAAEPFNYLIENPKAIIGLIDEIEGVKFASSRIEFSGLISTGDNTVSFVGQGIEPAREMAVSDPGIMKKRGGVAKAMEMGGVVMESGEGLKTYDTYGMIAGKGLAAGIGVRPGEGLIIVSNTIGGSINALDMTLRGTFTTASKQFDDHFIRLPLATAQKLLHTESVQSIVVMLNKTEDTVRVKKRLERIF